VPATIPSCSGCSKSRDLGEQAVKNIAAQVRVWRVLLDGMVAIPARRQISRKYWRGGALSLTGLVIVIATVVLLQNLSFKSPRTHVSIPPQEKPALPLPDGLHTSKFLSGAWAIRTSPAIATC
jgi:hypothetical protein